MSPSSRPKGEFRSAQHEGTPVTQWIEVGPLDDIEDEDVMRFDHAGRTFAVYRMDNKVYATDGLCTHEKVHLADGLVMDHVIECPKHNGRFDIRDGRALGAPACVNLASYPTKVEGGVIFLSL